jgi:transcriptional regulator with XRE-family HTH domain
MTPKTRTIVEQLQHAIEHSGQTQYAIAQGSGISQSVLNRFINGERGISLETAAKLCDYLGIVLSKPRG